jgi:tetratricopeptide (TPR) repeat protein
MSLCCHRERLKGAWRSVRTDCFVTLLLAMTVNVYAATTIEQAQAAWAERDKPGQTERSIILWEQALRDAPQKTEVLLPLTKACGRAFRHAAIREERRVWADKARAYGAQAVAFLPNRPEAYALYAESLGQWAQVRKNVRSLKAVRQAVENLKKSIALDPHYAYAHMLLASFYHESPALLSVGDKDKALEEAKTAVAAGPGYAINHLVLARCYLDRGKKEEARKELETILQLTPPQDAIPETRSDQQTAREMLQATSPVDTSRSCDESNGYCSEKQ